MSEPQPGEVALERELKRVRAEVTALVDAEAEFDAWVSEAEGLIKRLKTAGRERSNSFEGVRVIALGVALMLLLAGAFSIDLQLGSVAVGVAFATLIWEAVK